MPPWNPLPTEGAGNVDPCPSAKIVTATWSPALNSVSRSASTPEFAGPAASTRLGQMARPGLGNARGTALAESDLYGCCNHRSGVFTWVTRLLDTSSTVPVWTRHPRQNASHANLATNRPWNSWLFSSSRLRLAGRYYNNKQVADIDHPS